MEQTGIDKKDLGLLEEINKIKYWRRIRLIKLSIAIGLVFGIFSFAYINYSYASDIRQLRNEHSDLWSCYLCGYENLRTCSCIYSQSKIEINEEFKINLGENNIKNCNLYSPVETKILNFTQN